ncbi:MAG: hypothetical protein E6313_06740 [Finegoldia magna]|nr:hypothetical protein [Finegoldia magna]
MINLAFTFLKIYPSIGVGAIVASYLVSTAPSFNGESVIIYSSVLSTETSSASASSAATVTVVVTLNLPASVGFPVTFPVASSIVSSFGSPVAL